MAKNSKIEWTDHTFNPWVGCTKISPACDNCYAEAWAKRAGKAANVTWGAERRRTSQANWQQPLKWNEKAKAEGRRHRVFCASLADVFDNEVPVEWRRDLFSLMLSTPHLDWLLLTKRIGNAARMIDETLPDTMKALPPDCPVAWPWLNVWIGATICNQAEADRDIQKLLAVPAVKRFLSVEPMLGPIRLGIMHNFAPTKGRGGDAWPNNMIDWVIVGGESGPGARPMHPDWARALRDQCRYAGVSFFFKQWGGWSPYPDEIGDQAIWMRPDGEVAPVNSAKGELWWRSAMAGKAHRGTICMERVGKKAAGRLLDCQTWDEVPS